MNRRISQGQAIRSVFGRARVTHLMAAASSWLLLAGVEGVGGSAQAVEVEVAAGGVVAGDRPEGDGLVDRGGGQPVPVGGVDPGVEGVVGGPPGDHDRLQHPVGVVAVVIGGRWGLGGLGGVLARGAVQHQLEEDAVLLADGPVGLDPGTEPFAFGTWDAHGPQAHDHGRFLRPSPSPVPAWTGGACARSWWSWWSWLGSVGSAGSAGSSTRRNHAHKARS